MSPNHTHGCLTLPPGSEHDVVVKPLPYLPVY